MKRSILTAALLAGALAGAAGAAVQAREPAAPQQPRPATMPTASPMPVETAAPTGRLPDGRYSATSVHYRVRNVAYPVRVEDPGGGLPWTIKTFDADRLTLKQPSRTLKGARRIGRSTCVQVGRLQGRTFGWVYGDGVFRRTGIEHQIMQCTGFKRPEPIVSFFTTLAITDPAAPKLARSVVFGLLPGAPDATVGGTGAADGKAASKQGAFLRVTGPDARPGIDAKVAGGGHSVAINPVHEFPEELRGRLKWPTVIPGTQRAEAPAPDPAGGPRWAIPVAETREGVPCAGGETRVVEDRTGRVDLGLALFWEYRLTDQACRPLQTRPSAERPCDIGTGFGQEPEVERNDAFVARARIERRLLEGRSTVRAQCSADVERVTLRTPRDIRTLVPSPVGHVVLAVYDGDFVSGRLQLTAHLRGGKTWTEDFPLGF